MLYGAMTLRSSSGTNDAYDHVEMPTLVDKPAVAHNV